MKKLLATILAFSCAFGAWAEEVSHLSGTDFSTYPVGAFSTETDDSGVAETDQRYWFTGSKEDFDRIDAENNKVSADQVYQD